MDRNGLVLRALPPTLTALLGLSRKKELSPRPGLIPGGRPPCLSFVILLAAGLVLPAARLVRRVWVVALAVCSLVAAPAVAGEGQILSGSKAAGCRSLMPASVGGPLPPSGVMSIRWLGTTNFEIAYRGQIVLFEVFKWRLGRSSLP